MASVNDQSYKAGEIKGQAELRHEFSLCRVYVISGSFGSFDRRPRLNNELQQLEGSNNNRGKQVPAAATEAAAVTNAHDNSQVGEPSGTNWDAVNNTVETEVEESLWEWDQLNWL